METYFCLIISPGDRVYTAHWGSTPIEVTCQDVTEDVNGNQYEAVFTYSQKYYLAEGASINASLWGNNVNDTSRYILDRCETITVSKSNHNVRKFARLGYSAAAMFNSWAYSGGDMNFTANITLIYANANGDIISTQDKTVSGSGAWDLSNEYPNGSPAGTFYKINSITSGNYRVKAINKFALFTKDGVEYYHNADVIWDYDSGMYYLGANLDGRIWNESNHEFQTLYWSFWRDSRYSNLVHNYYYVKKPNEAEQKIDRRNLEGWYPKGTTIRTAYDNETKPGWVYNDAGQITNYYRGGQGAHAFCKIGQGETFTLDAPANLDDAVLAQDAYGVTFNANGGAGSMNNQYMPNTGDRTLHSNAYAPPGDLTFKGWATSQDNANKGIVAYADRAVMPQDTNHEHLCQMVTLYAVWG